MTHAAAHISGLSLSAPSNSLAPRPRGADNCYAGWPSAQWVWGPATTPRRALSWVCRGLCRGFFPVRSTAYTQPRRHDAKLPPSTCAHVRVCARMCVCVSWRRGVVSLSIYLKRKKESHDAGHDKVTTCCRGLVKPLENLNKGGF
jgi:hypothetical protein